MNLFKRKRELVVKEPPVTEVTVMNYIREFMPSSGLNDNEIKAFISMAKLHGLNPYKREIYCTAYGKGNDRKLSIVTGYQVYLQRAEASGKLDGFKTVIEGEGKDMTCEVIIYRKDMNGPICHKVYRSEWDTGYSMWKKAPKFMLEKTCLGQGFRKAFPNELGGMPYTEEEMEFTKTEGNNLEATIGDLKKKTVGEILKKTDSNIIEEKAVEAFSGTIEPVPESPQTVDRASVVKLLPKSGLDGMAKAKMFSRIQEADDQELQKIYVELWGE